MVSADLKASKLNKAKESGKSNKKYNHVKLFWS